MLDLCGVRFGEDFPADSGSWHKVIPNGTHCGVRERLLKRGSLLLDLDRIIDTYGERQINERKYSVEAQFLVRPVTFLLG